MYQEYTCLHNLLPLDMFCIAIFLDCLQVHRASTDVQKYTCPKVGFHKQSRWNLLLYPLCNVRIVSGLDVLILTLRKKMEKKCWKKFIGNKVVLFEVCDTYLFRMQYTRMFCHRACLSHIRYKQNYPCPIRCRVGNRRMVSFC
jgi:hypothetical protein